MDKQQIYITQADADKLRELMWNAESTNYRGSQYLAKLKDELSRAIIVDPQNIPSDVITMNSTASLLDVEANEEMVYTLVFPAEADVSKGKISVLAPIGTAMLGYREGSTFEWETPGGKRVIRVQKILYQPESSGNYQ